ncbi:hypothetical protein [Bacillus altitudinis]|uniref:hypothetical protein n=2 Tax=Bacillus altitudinis TaxID=293387 RepID=UPI001B820B70|nr:hypothetical protein [Bacillus altitudinis]MBR0581188.1 hypothetical protein [Bacillus altitudinis A23-8]
MKIKQLVLSATAAIVIAGGSAVPTFAASGSTESQLTSASNQLSTPYMDLSAYADSASVTISPPQWKAVSGTVIGKGQYGKIKLYSTGVAGLFVQEKSGNTWLTMGGYDMTLEEAGELTLDYWMEKGKEYRIEIISGTATKTTGTIRNSLN